MATIHILYDPNDRLRPGFPDDTAGRFSEIKFAVLKRDPPESPDKIKEVAAELAELLIKAM